MSEELKQVFAQNLKNLLNESGRTQSDLAKHFGVSSATASDWCNGNKMPRSDRLQSIANWFGVELSYLLADHTGDIQENPTPAYYFNDDAREAAEWLHKNPDYKVLFDASRKVRKEDIDFVKQMIDRMTGGFDD